MRLTMRIGGTAYWKNGENAGYRPDDVCFQSEVERLDKLADYEDTGLSPEEFRERTESVLELYGKLKPYAGAEEQGRLVILPCKVGDTVYVLRCGLGANFLSVYPSSVIGFKIGRIENTIEVDPSYQGYSECYSAKDWGVYVFPTRKEAEAALKGGQDE